MLSSRLIFVVTVSVCSKAMDDRLRLSDLCAHLQRLVMSCLLLNMLPCVSFRGVAKAGHPQETVWTKPVNRYFDNSI